MLNRFNLITKFININKRTPSDRIVIILMYNVMYNVYYEKTSLILHLILCICVYYFLLTQSDVMLK